ncbi:hypothetical protein NE546_17910 [Neglectibacter timonensis]|uniref:hypothetical protein n=1 Tax=Neglectibacter timonensis TaxID=1776382 RepID=UPI0011C75590|nr:hypothetical protein [Neglectibacter timonensis]MCQ4845415.1 hypothetical protein [Neglectibacter timonensis]
MNTSNSIIFVSSPTFNSSLSYFFLLLAASSSLAEAFYKIGMGGNPFQGLHALTGSAGVAIFSMTEKSKA